MSLLNILEFPDSRLRKVARPVAVVDDEIRTLAQDMLETMYAAPGIGLAATQVDVHQQVIVLDVSEEHDRPQVFINPEILKGEGLVVTQEGCLSVPGVVDLVERPERAVARCLDVNGEEQFIEGEGLLARALCHETDHLNGLLFVQRISGMRGDMVRRRARKLQREGTWDDVHP